MAQALRHSCIELGRCKINPIAAYIYQQQPPPWKPWTQNPPLATRTNRFYSPHLPNSNIDSRSHFVIILPFLQTSHNNSKVQCLTQRLPSSSSSSPSFSRPSASLWSLAAAPICSSTSVSPSSVTSPATSTPSTSSTSTLTVGKRADSANSRLKMRLAFTPNESRAVVRADMAQSKKPVLWRMLGP
jgi:hypothetical protein